MKITAFVRGKNIQKIRFKVTRGRNKSILYHVSEFEIDTKYWSAKEQGLNSRMLVNNSLRTKVDTFIFERKKIISEAIVNAETSEDLNLNIVRILSGGNCDETFFDLLKFYINNAEFSRLRKAQYWVLFRALQRFEDYSKLHLRLNESPDTIDKFRLFLRDEHLHGNYKRRSINTVSGILKKLSIFFNWLKSDGHIEKSPFEHFKIKPAIYGTPYYINIEERNRIYACNLKRHKSLACQRDIFVFQCLVGCRVGDLLKLRKENFIDGYLEYIAQKTKHEKLRTIRVPLHKTAVEILERYDYSLPFISCQKYNSAIKLIFKAARVNRIVSILNPLTRDAEYVPISAVASSHLARRTFIGNLYKQVRDPNLIGALSGHSDGSRAFSRYREIDDDIKKDIVNLL